MFRAGFDTQPAGAALLGVDEQRLLPAMRCPFEFADESQTSSQVGWKRIHFMDVMNDGMVVDPENGDDEETEQEGEEFGRELNHPCAERSEGRILQFRDVQFEDENGQDDGEHAIAEGFEAGFGHGFSLLLTTKCHKCTRKKTFVTLHDPLW